MENELLKIFDAEGNEIGVASRADVHKLGYWHEAIHCWFIGKEEDVTYIYFQIRSKDKKDYPNLLDITAAGHLLSHETVKDGVREIKEELGIDLIIDELKYLGLIKYYATKKDELFIDKELAYLYLYNNDNIKFADFKFQKEEVSGVVRADFEDFCDLYLGSREEIKVEGICLMDDGKTKSIEKQVTKSNFVPHEEKYYVDIINLLKVSV